MLVHSKASDLLCSPHIFFVFAGIHDGVAAKLRKNHGMPCLELSTCVAHTYALVGKHAGQYLDGKLCYMNV